jgi:CPA1 family monovalent cation:H+ antiporter
MHFGTQEELVLLALIVAFVALLVAAPRLRVPFPVLLVLGGLALSFVPGIPELELSPDLVLVAILPPLLYSSAFFTSLRDFRTHARPISVLAVGLVLTTMTGVALVAHAVIDGMSWSTAFVLGAIVAPTDPLAATSIMRRLGVPRGVVTVVEGESLVNDGTALVLYRVAVAATVSGTFSLFDASWRLLWSIAGGVAVGLVVGYLVAHLRRRLDNPPVEVTISLATGYVAFIPADAIEASGVIAAVTAGIFLGWRTPELTSVQVRLTGQAFWEIVVFVINAILFALVGLQMRGIVDSLSGYSAMTLIGYAALVTGTVILIRLLFVPVFTSLPTRLLGPFTPPDPGPQLPRRLVIAWGGMRGSVSLAAALAIPLATDFGTPFPQRNLIIFLTFSVILGTLVLQGLTLPALIRMLGLEPDQLDEKLEAKARIRAAEAALGRLEELVDEDWVRDDTAERMRGMYNFRRDRFASRFDSESDGAIEERSQDYQRLRRELLEAERGAIVQLRRDGVINDDDMRRLTRDLDLEDARLEI